MQGIDEMVEVVNGHNNEGKSRVFPPEKIILSCHCVSLIPEIHFPDHVQLKLAGDRRLGTRLATCSPNFNRFFRRICNFQTAKFSVHCRLHYRHVVTKYTCMQPVFYSGSTPKGARAEVVHAFFL